MLTIELATSAEQFEVGLFVAFESVILAVS
jgi:hypothetical protein